MMPRGRQPRPDHRIAHGTRQGHKWHTKMRKKDPEHETCQLCKAFWNKHINTVRRQRREQKTLIANILIGGQERARLKGKEQDVKDIHRLVTRYGTPEQKEALYGPIKHENPPERVHEVPTMPEIVVFHVQSEPDGAGGDWTTT